MEIEGQCGRLLGGGGGTKGMLPPPSQIIGGGGGAGPPGPPLSTPMKKVATSMVEICMANTSLAELS